MADRSVSFDILAIDKASQALAGVAREVTTLGERIDRTDGTINVDADTAKAREKLAAIDSQLARLNAKSLKVDADTAQAERQLAILQAELKKTTDEDRKMRLDLDISTVQAKIRALAAEKVSIDVDTAAAGARLRALESDVSRVSGRTARVSVDADVTSALQNLASVTAAAAAIPSTISIAVGAVGALAGVGSALGAGMGAGIAGTVGLGDAVKAMGEQSTKAGGAATSSASAIRSANQAVVDARRDLVRANENVGDAEKNLARAQEDAQRAQEALTDARKAASRELEDYQLRAAGMALSEESAALSVQEAQARLQKVNEDATSTSLERARAELTVREALQRQNELSVEAKRLTEDKTAADAKGVEGSDQVVAAQGRIRDANDKVVEAQRNLVRAQEGVQQATERVAEALTRLHEAAAPKGGGGGGVDKLAEAMDNLGPKGQAFAKYLRGLIDGPLKDLRVAGQEAFLPGVQSGLEQMERKLPGITPEWTAFSREVGAATGNLIAIGAEMGGPFLGYAAASLQGLQPLEGVLQQLEQQLAATFAEMEQSGDAEQAMRAVVDVVGALLPVLPPLIESGAQAMIALGPGLTDVVRALGQGLTDAEPAIVAVAGTLGALLSTVAPIAPELVILGGALMLVSRMGVSIPGPISMASGAVTRLRDAARDIPGTLDSAAGRVQSFTQFLGGPWGIALMAGTLILGNWVKQHVEASQRINELTSAIERDSGVVGENSRQTAINALEKEGAYKAAKELGISLKDVTDATMGNADAMARVQAVTGQDFWNRTQRDMALDDWAAKTAIVSDAIKGESGAIGDAVEKTKRLAEANGQASTSAGQHATALQGTATAADGTNSAMQRLTQTQQEAAGAFLNSEQSSLRYEQALTRMTESIATNGRTMNENTTAGQANKESLLALVSAANDHISSMERSNAPIGEVTATFSSQREELIRVATQVLGNKDKAQQYIDKILQIPKSAGTSVTLDTSQAEAALRTWQANVQAVAANSGVPYSLGLFVGRSAGGWVPGAPSRVDTVPARLAGGEFVVQSSAAQEWGPLLERINAGESPSDLTLSATSSPLVPIAAGARSSGGGAGGGGTTILQVSLSGVVAGDEAAFSRAILRAIQQGVSRGELPRTLLSS